MVVSHINSALIIVTLDGTETVWVTLLRTSTSFPNANALVAISRDMWAIKLCANKIFQFLTGGAGYRRLAYMLAVKWWLVVLS